MIPPILNPYEELFRQLDPPADAERARSLRRKLVWAYSWAVPSREAVAEIAAHSPLIEIGAGTGYWSWLLSQAGADILAFDRNPAAPPHWFEVREGGPEALARHPGRTLFLCWPPLDEPLALECLERYPGEVVLHVGERGPRARTGSRAFEARLEAEFGLEREVAIPRWPGYSDSLTSWRRR